MEESRDDRIGALQDWLEEHSDELLIEPGRPGRYVLRPRSEQGEDALALSNQLTEEVGPELSQVRFVRVVPRPGRSAAERSAVRRR